MKLSRPKEITFELPCGSKLIVPPPTRQQMREVFALEEAGASDDPVALDRRRAESVSIFCRPAKALHADGTAVPIDVLLGQLTPDAEIDIIFGMIAQHYGFDPASAVTLNQGIREVFKKKASIQSAS